MVNEVGLRGFTPQFDQQLASAQSAQKGTTEALREQVDAQREEQDKKALQAELMDLSQKLNEEMRQMGTDLRFNYNDNIPGLTVTIKDRETEKVIREIPSKEAIDLMKKMRDIIGIIFDKQA